MDSPGPVTSLARVTVRAPRRMSRFHSGIVSTRAPSSRGRFRGAKRRNSPLPPGASTHTSPRIDDLVTALSAGDLHDLTNWVYRLRPYPRPIGATDVAAESVASSALQRTQQDPAYRPEQLMAYLSSSRRRI